MTNGSGLNDLLGARSTGRSVAICGAGGHARVVADVLSRQKPSVTVSGFLDDRSELHGVEQVGKTVIGDLSSWLESASPEDSVLIVGIGNNRDRERIASMISEAGFTFASAIHPSAQIGHGVRVGAGSVLMANTVINTGAVIGEHVIINTSASVDHDCVVEDFSHISPGVNLAGGVTVGRGAHIGTGACAIPGVRIGEWAKVGAGATVMSDVPPYATVVGNPAESLRDRVRRSTIR